jgi:hypothetical protein
MRLPEYKKFYCFFFKRNQSFYSFLLLSTIVYIASDFIEEKIKIAETEYCFMQKYTDFVNNLKKDPNNLKFISEHLFAKCDADFGKFVNEAIIKNKGEMISFQKGSKTSFAGAIAKETAIIAGIFWHDYFIFDFVNSIESFNPGFAKVVAIEIERIGDVNPSRPIIRALIQCEIFQKQ